MSPTIANDIFAPRATPYNLHNPIFKMRRVQLVYRTTETLSHLELKLWSLVSHEKSLSVSLADFKSKTTNRTPSNCLARYAKGLSNRSYLNKITRTS